MLVLCHIVNFDASRSNGPSVSVRHLSDSMNLFPSVRSFYVRPDEFQLEDEIDLVIFHGVWSPKFWALASSLRAKNVPYIVTPRSNLVQASFKKSMVKKLIGTIVGAQKYIRGAVGLHFLSEEEAVRSLRFQKDYMVVSNGLNQRLLDQPEALFNATRQHLPNKYLLYIGRLDIYHKGIDILLKALCKSAAHFRTEEVKVVIGGDPMRNDANRVAKMISNFGLEDIIKLIPRRIDYAEKWYMLKKASGFIHTSRYEGEPQAVLEALVHGLPVLVTKGANLDRLVMVNNYGIVCETDVASVAVALENFIERMAKSEQKVNERIDMLKSRDWESVAKDTLHGYQGLLNS